MVVEENQNYLPRFYTKPNFEALAGIREACAEAGISMVSASYAWLLQHSALSAEKGDGLLIGASSLVQLDENLSACFSPPQLPESLVSAFDAAWTLACTAQTLQALERRSR
ncbi:Akr7a2 [Symbiodinium microadriaticum]|nr:Akr7a2 [Symbiodinium microadriaticum]